ncbi:MAG: alpha/beta hydrolase fold domain-containing protein [Isosphaeraceae bacterium]
MKPSKPVQVLRIAAWVALAATTGWVSRVAERAFRAIEPASAVVLRKDVPYRLVGGSPLLLDVYLPPSGGEPGPDAVARPAILLVHGGSWVGGTRRLLRPGPGNPRPMAIQLAESGFVVIAPDYRLARPGRASWPSALDDLREAVRWTRRHAGELGIDPDRIAAAGQSAGGHLAMLLGTIDPVDDTAAPSSRVRAVASLSGPADLARLPLDRPNRLAHEPVEVFLGRNDPGAARAASPVHRIHPATAPMLLIHGTHDAWVPIAQAERMDDALEKAGIAHRLVRVEGARHGFDLDVRDPEVPGPLPRRLLPEILAFLNACGMLQAGESP